jgi:hypothetical protein
MHFLVSAAVLMTADRICLHVMVAADPVLL